MTSTRAKIGLLRGITKGNLGNAAFEASAVQHLADYFPEADIYVSCIDSLETLRPYGVQLFPVTREAEILSNAAWAPPPPAARASEPTEQSMQERLGKMQVARRFLRPMRGVRAVGRLAQSLVFWMRSYKFCKKLTLLILCGGGQLNDAWGGPWGNPFMLFMWTTLARLARTPVLVLNVGSEQLSSGLSRWFFKRILRHASYRSFRDQDSKDAIAAWGPCGECHVYPDLAFSFKIPENLRRRPRAAKTGVIGISPMPFGDPRVWPAADGALYAKYLETLATFARYLLERDYTIVLFVTQTRMDRLVLKELRDLIVEKTPILAHRVSVSNAQTVEEILALVQEFDVVVATRFHAILLAQLMGTPTLAISYENKINALMADLGLSEFCVDIAALDLPALIDRFAMLEPRAPRVTDALHRRADEYRAALQQQYDFLFDAQSGFVRR